MADAGRLRYILEVDDKGTATIKKFDATAEKSLKKGQTRTQKLGKAFANVGLFAAKAAAAVGAVAAIGLGASIAFAIKFESAWAGVVKTMPDGADLAEVRQGIRDMAKEVPASTTAIAGVAEAAGQLGIKAENILDFTKTMIQLGDATNLSADEAATSMARLANIMGTPQDAFDEMGSTVVALGNNLATTEAEIVEMGLRLAGAGKTIGLTEAQVLSFAGALSSVGIAAEAGGTAFSRTMIEMDKAVSEGGDKLERWAKVAGISGEKFRQVFEEDGGEALLLFTEGLGEIDKSGGNVASTLDNLGLKGTRVQDSLRRAASAGDLFRDSMELGNKAWKENNALQKEVENRYATTASQLGMLKNQFVDILTSIGEGVLPMFKDLIERAREWIFTMEEAGIIDEIVAQIVSTFKFLGEATTGVGDTLDDLLHAFQDIAGDPSIEWVDIIRGSVVFLGDSLKALIGVGRLTWIGLKAGFLGLAKILENTTNDVMVGFQIAFKSIATAGATLGSILYDVIVVPISKALAFISKRGAVALAMLGFKEKAAEVFQFSQGLGDTGKTADELRGKAENLAAEVATLGIQLVNGDFHTRKYDEALEVLGQEALEATAALGEIGAVSYDVAAANNEAAAATKAFREKAEAARKAADALARSEDDAADSAENLAGNTDKLSKEQDRAAKAFDRFGAKLGVISQSDLDQEMGDLVTIFAQLQQRGISSGPVFEKVAKAMFKVGQKAEAAGLQTDEIFDMALQQATGDLDLVALGLVKAEKSVDIFGKTIKRAGGVSAAQFTKGAGDMIDSLERLQAAGVTSGPVFERLLGSTLDFEAAARASGVSTTVFRDRLLVLGKAAGLTDEQLANVGTTVVDTAAKGETGFGALAGAAQGFGDTVGRVFGQVLEGSMGLVEGLKAIGSSLVNDLFGGFSKGLQGLLGGAGGGGGGGGLLGGLMSGISGLFGGGGMGAGGMGPPAPGGALGGLGGMLAGSLSGALTMGIGTAISVGGPLLVQGLMGLFGGKPMWKKVQDEVESQFGFALSEGTAQAIADTAKKLDVGADMAVLLNLGAVISEAELAGDGVERFGQATLDAMGLVAQGGAIGEEALRSADESARALIDDAVEFGTTGSAAFRQWIATIQESGVELEAVQAFIEEKLMQAVEGVTALFENMGEVGQAEFDDLGIIARATFDALAEEVGLLEAMEAMAPAIDKLVEAHKNLGLELSEDNAKLVRMRNLFSRNEEAIASIDGLKNAMQGLAEAGHLNEKTYSAFQRQIARTNDDLIAGGFSAAEALELQAPVLQEIINHHLATGDAIDRETQAMIEQADQLGLVNTAGTGLEVTFLRVGQAIVDTMGAAFGVEVPQLLGTTAAAAEDAATRSTSAFESSTAEVVEAHQEAAEAVNEAWTDSTETVEKEVEDMADTTTSALELLAEEIARESEGVVDSTEGLVAGVVDAQQRFLKDTAGSTSTWIARIRAELEALRDIQNAAGDSVPEFDVGGYVVGPRGIAHAGEYVVRREAVDAIGLSAFEQFINKGQLPPNAEKTTAAQASGGAPPPSESRGGGGGPTNVRATFVLAPGVELPVQVVEWVNEAAESGDLRINPDNIRDRGR